MILTPVFPSMDLIETKKASGKHQVLCEPVATAVWGGMATATSAASTSGKLGVEVFMVREGNTGSWRTGPRRG